MYAACARVEAGRDIRKELPNHSVLGVIHEEGCIRFQSNNRLFWYIEIEMK